MRSAWAVVSALADQPASGEWHRIRMETVSRVEHLADKIASFKSLDFPAGDAAARFLQHDALDPGASVVTTAMVGPDRIEGFVATNFTEVEISRADAADIGVTYWRKLPAFRLAWIARHRDTSVSGLELFAAAYGLAMEAAECGGLVAIVVDPADETVAEVWKREPYCFEESDALPNAKGLTKLWLPLGI